MSNYETNLLAEAIASAADLIDARVALTGRPREVYETYLTRPPRSGQTWEDALHGRMESLAAGPLPAHVAERMRRQVRASRSRGAEAA